MWALTKQKISKIYPIAIEIFKFTFWHVCPVMVVHCMYDTTICFKSLQITYLTIKKTNEETEKLLDPCLAQNCLF